jgi:hypothetical protein
MLKKLLLFLALLFLPLTAFGASISTLTDNFNDNSIDAAKWNNSGSAEANNELELTTTLAPCDIYIYSVDSYDLTGSQATIKVIDAGNQSLFSLQVFPIEIYKNDFSDSVQWCIRQGNIYALQTASTVLASATYVDATYKYLKIREAGGTTYFDYSADGITWTNFYSFANPFVVTSILALIEASTFNIELSTTTAKVEDFNILPTVIPFTKFNRGLNRGFNGGFN